MVPNAGKIGELEPLGNRDLSELVAEHRVAAEGSEGQTSAIRQLDKIISRLRVVPNITVQGGVDIPIAYSNQPAFGVERRK